MPVVRRKLSSMDVILALSLVLFALVVGRETMRRRAAVRQSRAGEAAVAGPTVTTGDVRRDGAPIAGTRSVGARAMGGVRGADATGAAAARQVPGSRLDDPRAVAGILRAQTHGLREETAADKLDPKQRRALTLTQEEILQLERENRLIF